jgi:hypothetical protein
MASIKRAIKRKVRVVVRDLKNVKALGKKLSREAIKSGRKTSAKLAKDLVTKAKEALKRAAKKKPPKLTPKQVAREVALFNSLRITVGIHDDKGSEVHSGGTLSVAEIMAVHEYGAEIVTGYVDTPTIVIPQRSWLRDWFDNEQASLRAVSKDLARLVAKGAITAKVAGARLGSLCVGGIQKRIANGIPPALAQSTIDRKGSSKPLIDTGQSRGAIAFKLHFGQAATAPTGES